MAAFRESRLREATVTVAEDTNWCSFLAYKSAAAEIARQANAYIREMAEQLDAVARNERPVGFICECGCLRIVETTVAEYASADGAWIEGHRSRL